MPFKIAVVDDNEAWAFVVDLFLSQKGFMVSVFSDPYTFLEQAEQFDLALVDFSIPLRSYQKDIDGSKLICSVKQRLENPPLLVLISAYFTEAILADAQEICPEADGHLGKGTELEEIFRFTKQLLDSKKQHAEQNQVMQFASRNLSLRSR
jgi:DNA-binding response OmpR family regulator